MSSSQDQRRNLYPTNVENNFEDFVANVLVNRSQMQVLNEANELLLSIINMDSMEEEYIDQLEFTFFANNQVTSRATVPTDPSTLLNLKRVKVEEIMDNLNDEVCCSLCLENWAKEEQVMILPCDHIFHVVCVEKWLNINHFCPLCRFELPTAPINV